ncbi:MAG: MATE family efflux transporter [Bacteroidetes bacterium]|nr:MATE family efflux transporter [Bacteroidota bacterium]
MTIPQHTNISYNRILQVAFPIMLGGLADNLNSVINTAFVSSLGEVSTGAVGLGSLYYLNFIIIALGLALGHQIIVARRNGEGNFEEAGRTYMHALQLFAVLGVALFGVIYFTSNFILSHLVHSVAIRDKASAYLNIRMWGAPIICVSVCMRSFFIGITKTKVITLVTLISAGTNVLLDYLLIFGHWGFPKLGIEGAGYASLIAEGISFGGYMTASLVLPFLKPYKLFVIRKRSAAIWANILKVGSPMMLQNWVSFSSWFLFFILIENMGERALAVSTVIKNIYLLFLIPMWGIAAATNTLTSNLIGEGRTEEVPQLLKKIIILSFSIMIILIQPNLWLSANIISIFNKTPEFISAAQGPLWIISLALLFFCVGMVFYNGVSGAGDTKTAMGIELITIVCYISYLLIVTKLFVPNMSIVWGSEWFYMGIIGILSYWRLSTGKWKGKKV